MPRSRRRHHSRSRSRSHSHDKDREPKRRKIESFDSPHHKRSLSSEPEAIESPNVELPIDSPTETPEINSTTDEIVLDEDLSDADENETSQVSESVKTPVKPITPKQIQKRLESEKKRAERQKFKEERERKKVEEREEKERKRQEERDKKKQEKERQQLEKDKERELKRKEREDKEEAKRKEKDLEKLKRQLEVDEKNRERQKQDELKQKEKAAFAKFFVPKKAEVEEANVNKRKEETSLFMPFEIKLNMRLAPTIRKILDSEEKNKLCNEILKQHQSKLYLAELQEGKPIGKSTKTWLEDEDVTIIDDFGESILEEKLTKMKAKFLKFHENQRPPYFGTWRKRSKLITPLKPFGLETSINYEIDSDEEWEDVADGESLVGSDQEEKENESENDNDNDYEVDNDLFVPHAYLSEDEGCDEDETAMCPETQKAKLKLMHTQFEEERKSKTERIKPRLIGCVWQEEGKLMDDAIDRCLKPLAVLTNVISIRIKKRTDPNFQPKKVEKKGLEDQLIPEFLKHIHGNTNKRRAIVNEYLERLITDNVSTCATKNGVMLQWKKLAKWIKCPDEGPQFNKYCWYINADIQTRYNVCLTINQINKTC